VDQNAEATTTRVYMTSGRAIVARTDDDKWMQRVQARVLSNETKDDIEHFQPYGFTSHPKPGAEALIIFIGGNRTHGIAPVVDDRRYRLRHLEPGEVALYTDEGTSVVLKRGKVVEVTCDEFRLTCKKLTLEASDSIAVTSPSIDVNKD
jgi:phage baseplate assembly protein V